MSLPDYAVDFRGRPACPCQAAWLPAYERELKRRGLIPGSIHIFQLIGGAPLSGGTHIAGGAADFFYEHPNMVWVARQMGADATWHRPFNWDGNGGSEHVHSVLRGCVHNGPAQYQIDAVDMGYNGLGHLGFGAPDDGPRPLKRRTWREGLAWQHAQEDDMPGPKDWDAEDWAAFADKGAPAVAKAVWTSAMDNAGTKAKSALEAAGRYAKRQLGE